ncbi:MAG: hypothetical protein PHT12_00440 [Patescibacteria group bacterium]|nr:hypothetical protein [Patescibacteria group bacterium]
MAKRLGLYETCSCGAYHYDHRRGSGDCGHPERIWARRLIEDMAFAERQNVILSEMLERGCLRDADESGFFPDFTVLDPDIPF